MHTLQSVFVRTSNCRNANAVIGFLSTSQSDILLNVFLAIAVDNLADADALGESDEKEAAVEEAAALEVVFLIISKFDYRINYLEKVRTTSIACRDGYATPDSNSEHLFY